MSQNAAQLFIFEFGSVVAAQLANFEPMFEDNVLIERLEGFGHLCLVAEEINKYRPRVLVDKVDGVSIAPSNIGLANMAMSVLGEAQAMPRTHRAMLPLIA